MATVVVKAVPTLEVVMSGDGGDGVSEHCGCMPAQAVGRSHFSSVQTQWLRTPACCPFPTHRIPVELTTGFC